MTAWSRAEPRPSRAGQQSKRRCVKIWGLWLMDVSLPSCRQEDTAAGGPPERAGACRVVVSLQRWEDVSPQPSDAEYRFLSLVFLVHRRPLVGTPWAQRHGAVKAPALDLGCLAWKPSPISN